MVSNILQIKQGNNCIEFIPEEGKFEESWGVGNSAADNFFDKITE